MKIRPISLMAALSCSLVVSAAHAENLIEEKQKQIETLTVLGSASQK